MLLLLLRLLLLLLIIIVIVLIVIVRIVILQRPHPVRWAHPEIVQAHAHVTGQGAGGPCQTRQGVAHEDARARGTRR